MTTSTTPSIELLEPGYHRTISDLSMNDDPALTKQLERIRRRKKKPVHKTISVSSTTTATTAADTTTTDLDHSAAIVSENEDSGSSLMGFKKHTDNDEEDRFEFENDDNDDADEDDELELEDLMDMSSQRSQLSRSSAGSNALKIMHESFNGSCTEGSMNSFGDSFANMDLDGPGHECRRRLPLRTGSGYVRTVQRTSTGSLQRTVRTSVTTTALKEKRRSSALNASMTSLGSSQEWK